jgi:hypothetical protein
MTNSTLVDTIVSDQDLVKFGIFKILSFIFGSGEIRRFQAALMGNLVLVIIMELVLISMGMNLNGTSIK